MTDRLDELLEEARDRFKLASDAEAEQREQEVADLRFQVPEQQWTEAARADRLGGDGSPARPMLSITQIDAPIRLTRNQARAAKLGVNIHPVSEDSDEETAEIIQGLYRRIERDSNANTARMWAFDRALKCGRGVYKIVTRYDEDSPDTFDQEIGIQRILHQGSVYLDPAASEPDWSDGRYAFEVVWMPLSDFKAQYPEASAANARTGAEWESVANMAPNWVRGGYGRGDEAVQVAQYWFKETLKVRVEVEGRPPREREEHKVYSCHITGAEVLEPPQLWPGKYIPYVQVLGNELQPFDERRRFSGMITNAKDAQRMFNFAASALVEGMSIEPKAPWVGAEGQFEGHEEKWNLSNQKNYSYMEYKPKALDGVPLPPPARAQVDGTRMSLASMALQQAAGFVQSTTAVHEPSLGKQDKDVRSGRALLALQGQADMSNGDYVENLAQVGMVHEARIVLDLMPVIYDRPGRITRIIRGDDEKSEPVGLNAPFVAKNGKPQRVAPGTQGAKVYDLTKGRYGLSVDVGRSYRTRLQEGDETLTRLIEAYPPLLELAGDILFTFKDTPGAKEIAKRLAKVREMKNPGIGEGEDGNMPPEQIQARALAMQQENAQLKQQLQAAAQALQTDQAKQQAQMGKAQIDAQVATAKAQQDAETALAKTKMETDSRELIAAVQEETKRMIAAIQVERDAFSALLSASGAHAERRDAQQERQEGQAERQSERREGMAHEVAMRSAEREVIPEGNGENP